MPTIWGLLPASLWSTQPFIPPPDPTQPAAWPQATPPNWSPSCGQAPLRYLVKTESVEPSRSWVIGLAS